MPSLMSPTLLFGALLIGLGVAFLYRHVRAWKRIQQQPQIDPTDRDFHQRQFHRRLRTSLLLVLLGILIPLGDWYFERNLDPLGFGYFVLGLLLLVALLLAWSVIDLIATANHTRGAVRRARARQARLAEDAQAILQSKRNRSL